MRSAAETEVRAKALQFRQEDTLKNYQYATLRLQGWRLSNALSGEEIGMESGVVTDILF